jgi:hypothetical protein
MLLPDAVVQEARSSGPETLTDGTGTTIQECMKTTYTIDSMYRLVCALLGPSWEERRAADWHLFAILGQAPEGMNPALMRLVDGATEQLGLSMETFLSELTAFWMSARAQVQAESAKFLAATVEGGTWPMSESAHAFPLREPVRVVPHDMYGQGAARYLVTQARRLGFLVDAYVRGLAHPDLTVSDACWEILGSVPGQARSAIEPMLDIAFHRGAWSAPGRPMRSLAAIFDAHPSAKDLLVSALAEPAEDRRAEVVSTLAELMTVVPPGLFAAMRNSLDILQGAEQRYVMMKTLSWLGHHANGDSAHLVLRRAEAMLSSAEGADRGGGAWGIALGGTPATHEPRLIALLRDRSWMTRADAAGAAAQWQEPSDELVRAVAELLGDCEGHDGQPHETALATLMAWGTRAAPAVGKLAAWMVSELDDELPRPDTVWGLIQALGPAASGVRSAVREVVAAYRRDNADAEDVSGDFMHDSPYVPAELGEYGGTPVVPPAPILDAVDRLPDDFDAPFAQPTTEHLNIGAWLIQQTGIDPDEEVPGTPPFADRAVQPEAIDLIEDWLRLATPSAVSC